MPLCKQVVRKLSPSDKDEWVSQIEREDVSKTVNRLAKWAQGRAKVMRKRERYNKPKDVGKHTFKKNEGTQIQFFSK